MIRHCILLSCLVFFFGCATYNPATNRNELIFITTPQEVSEGVKAHQELATKNKIITGTDESRRLEAIGKRLVRFSDRQDYEYHFNLVESNDINAFTIPGGYIYFYTGLFRKLKTDDQIAAVLAHEIGHCAAKHTIKKFQASMGYSLVGNIFSEILSVKAPSIKSIAMMGSNAIAQLAMTAYSRHDEYEADQLGIKYLYLAGYNLNGMMETFEVLEKFGGSNNAPLILQTHPYVKDRMVAAQKEISRIQHKN